MKVLALGLPRSGSSSMMEALDVLGFPEVYHMLKTPRVSDDYDVFMRACRAYFPGTGGAAAAGGRPDRPEPPLTREDWDVVFDTWEGIADVGAVFAPELVAAYPEAKVVVMRRPFEAWATSWSRLMALLDTPMAHFNLWVADPLAGGRRTACLRAMATAFVGARTFAETTDRTLLRRTYDEHHERLRRIVPADRLLEMDLGDDKAWHRLCHFLDRPVPPGLPSFPKRNTAADLSRGLNAMQRLDAADTLLRHVLPWAVLAAAAAGASWWWYTAPAGLSLL